MHRRPTVYRIVAPALIAAVISTGAPSTAVAQRPNPPSAIELYTSAQKLFDAGKYSDALLLFRQAYDASKSPNARLMIGTCYVALGRTAEAYEELAATVLEAEERSKADSKYKDTRDSAAQQLSLLENKVGKVVVGLGDVTDARVTVNGTTLAPERVGKPVAVEPGNVVVVATRADGSTARWLDKVEVGETKSADLVFEAPQDGSGNKEGQNPITNPPNIPPAPTGGGVRTAGYVVAGLGVVGMVIFGVTAGMANNNFATLKQQCSSDRCNDPNNKAITNLIDNGKTLQTVANVSLATGLSGIAGGGLMIILGGPQAPPQQGVMRAAPLSGAMISYSGTF